MKLLKKLGILLISLVCLILLIALFVRKDYHVTRTVEVNADSGTVFDYVRYLKNQEEFSVWHKMDPNMQKSLTGEDGQIGAVASWDSKKEDVGAGEQEIISIAEGERIDFELRFKKPWELTSNAYFTTQSGNNGKTKVTWGFDGASPWPWNFFLLFMNMDEELGPDLEKGLDNLKIILESEETQNI